MRVAGVDGAIVPVDAYRASRTPTRSGTLTPARRSADGVVAAISAVVDQIRAAYPSVQNLVIVGADDQIPFARSRTGQPVERA